jgi:hypothetical protein
MKRTTALLGSAVMVAATLLVTLPVAANAAPLTHDQTLALVPPAVTAAGLNDDQLSNWYLDSAGVTHVGLTSFTASQASALKATLGPATVITKADAVEGAEGYAPVNGPVAAKLLAPRSRSTRSVTPDIGTSGSGGDGKGITPGDYEPFLTVPTYPGGVRIVRQDGGLVVWCSTTALWGGKMLTAGHCGPNGTSWQQGYYENGEIAASGPAGKASSVHWEADNPDVALLSGGAGWDTGMYISKDKGNVSFVTVAGAAVSQVGTEVCTDGTTSGYGCGAKVTIVNGCVNMTERGKTVHECGMDSAYNPNTVITRPGDSGGPVITKPSGGKVVVAGDISGESNGGHTVWYSDVSRIKQILGSSITVG